MISRMHSQDMSKERSREGDAKCAYTGKPVDTPNDVEVSISREAVIEKIRAGKTRLSDE